MRWHRHVSTFTRSHVHTFIRSHAHLLTHTLTCSHVHAFMRSHKSHVHVFTCHVFTCSPVHTFTCSHVYTLARSNVHTSHFIHPLTRSRVHAFIRPISPVHTFAPRAHMYDSKFTRLHFHTFTRSHVLTFTPSNVHTFTCSHVLSFTLPHVDTLIHVEFSLTVFIVEVLWILTVIQIVSDGCNWPRRCRVVCCSKSVYSVTKNSP